MLNFRSLLAAVWMAAYVVSKRNNLVPGMPQSRQRRLWTCRGPLPNSMSQELVKT